MLRLAVTSSAAILLLGAACADPGDPTHRRGPATPDAASSLVADLGAPGPITSRLAAGTCMDVSGAATAPGTSLIIWPCHGGANQQFAVPAPGTTGEIRAYGGALCVDAASGLGNDGDPILVWGCHGGANQQWTLAADGTIRGINGKCIDVAASNPANGTPLILWPCEGGANQQWDAAGAAPPPPEVLVAAGDIASCTSSGDEATSALLESIPGVVVALGDLAYREGSAADFANCYEPSWGRHKARTKPTPGNHEYWTPGAAGYFAYFGAAAGDPAKGYYSYDLGAWHVVVVNSNCWDIGGCGAGSPQLAWLQADLAAHPARCTLAYWHHPRFSSGDHGNDTRTQSIWQVLYDAGADVVLNGHDHEYERFAPQTPTGLTDWIRGIRQFVVGTGGVELDDFVTVRPNSEVRYNAAFGVLKLELSATGYAWSLIGTDREVKDAGTGTCH